MSLGEPPWSFSFANSDAPMSGKCFSSVFSPGHNQPGSPLDGCPSLSSCVSTVYREEYMRLMRKQNPRRYMEVEQEPELASGPSISKSAGGRNAEAGDPMAVSAASMEQARAKAKALVQSIVSTAGARAPAMAKDSAAVEGGRSEEPASAAATAAAPASEGTPFVMGHHEMSVIKRRAPYPVSLTQVAASFFSWLHRVKQAKTLSWFASRGELMAERENKLAHRGC